MPNRTRRNSSSGSFAGPAVAIAGGLAAFAFLAFVLWSVRPFFHGLLTFFYQYPLVTWMPVVLGLAITAVGAVIALVFRGDPADGAALGGWTGAAAAGVMWVVCMVLLPSWQGNALYAATDYVDGASLPQTTQPRILPKSAASEYGERNDMRHAHLAVDPTTGQLTWTAERKGGLIPRGKSGTWAMQPLDRLDGSITQVKGGFEPSVSRVGPGSIRWRAYKRHFFTKVRDYVIVPTGDGKAVAVAPYIGFKGFFVKRPYLKGVYVYHQDGRLEDLTPEQAMSRPELVKSGRIFPETLARDIAEAYGYKSGAGAVRARRDRTKVSDPDGNPQPYLTNLGDGRIRWVTVAHPHDNEDEVSAVFLTDAASGRTEVWHAPKGEKLLSNRGAERLVYNLDLEWTRRVCCDADGYEYDETMRYVQEPRPVFAGGRFYYLVSIVTNRHYIKSREPVERTVLIDAAERSIVEVFEHNNSEADDRLRAFFEEAGRPADQVAVDPEGSAAVKPRKVVVCGYKGCGVEVRGG